jgi:diguanylate cyclase (GGDEF)-like protein
MSSPIRVWIALPADNPRRSELTAAFRAAGVLPVENSSGRSSEFDIAVCDVAERTPVGADSRKGLVVLGGGAASEPQSSDSESFPSFAADSATVTLPADASAREIVLACLLLGRILQLSRAQDDASRRENRLRALADLDPLTGLLNRRAFAEQIHEVLADGLPGRICCIAILDLDHFKPVNDRHGHLAGDAVLKQVADRLQSAVRKGDLVCRLGGDEFLLALFDVAEEVARRLVDRLRVSISEAGDRLEDIDLSRTKISASAGWAMLNCPATIAPIDRASAEMCLTDAIERADKHLRQAKSLGRDRTNPC